MILKLSRAALTNEMRLLSDELSTLTENEWNELFQLSCQHSIATLIWNVVAEYVKPYPKLAAEWKNTSDKGIVRELTFDAERASILTDFEKKGIKYLPLKGILINKLYPAPGMRQFADNDILYDKSRQDDLIKIMTEHGYEIESLTSNHDEFMKAPIFNFEMHKELMQPNSPFYSYYQNDKVWGRAVKDADSNYGYHMTDEDFFVYFLAHMYKHFYGGGTGIRSINDLYLLNRSMAEKQIDMEYMIEQLKEISLYDFYQDMNEVVAYVFDDAQYTEKIAKNLEYIVGSGTYGKKENEIENRVNRNDNLFKYTLTRLFPPLWQMRQWYDIVNNHPWTLPFVWIYRLIISIIRPERRKNARTEIQKMKDKTNSEM